MKPNAICADRIYTNAEGQVRIKVTSVIDGSVALTYLTGKAAGNRTSTDLDTFAAWAAREIPVERSPLFLLDRGYLFAKGNIFYVDRADMKGFYRCFVNCCVPCNRDGKPTSETAASLPDVGEDMLLVRNLNGLKHPVVETWCAERIKAFLEPLAA